MIAASAPGTLMLMGEHAVLHGRYALVAATDQMLHVKLTPRTDQIVCLQSALGEYRTSLKALEPIAPFTFVLSALSQFTFPGGFNLLIESDFSSTVGLGSSAAVLMSTLAVAAQFATGQPATQHELFERGLRSLHAVQGQGSGADLAASLYGGILFYRAQPYRAVPLVLSTLPPITLIYSGYKTPTATVIAYVEKERQADPLRFETLFDQINETVLAAKLALESNQFPAFATAMKKNQMLMTQMNLSDPTLDAILATLEAQPGILAAKISGSGRGDCVYGLGHAELQNQPGTPIPIHLSSKGLTCTHTP